MPNPQVPDRIKEAPAVVLRAIFAGIGQLLMAADKVWAQVQEQISSQQPTQSASPFPQAPQNTKAPETSQTSQAPRRNAAEADNVTLLRDESAPGRRREQPSTSRPAAAREPAPVVTHPAAARSAPAAPKPAPAPAPPAPAARKPAAAPRPAPAARKPATPAATDRSAPPIAGYDDLSVASLRARLRVLDASAVHALLDYERTHERRDEVITMFERRLIKIEDKAG